MAYKQTFVFHIYNSLILIANRFSNIKKKVKETKDTVKETGYKIEWEIVVAPKKILWETTPEENKEEMKVEIPKIENVEPKV